MEADFSSETTVFVHGWGRGDWLGWLRGETVLEQELVADLGETGTRQGDYSP